MRYFILFSFLLVASSAAFSQKMILGLNAGAAVSETFSRPPVILTTEDYKKPNIDPTATFKAGMAYKATEIGMAVSIYRHSYRVDDRYFPYNNDSWIMPRPHRLPFNGYTTYVMAQRAWCVQFYYNRKMKIGAFDGYYGFAMGQGYFYQLQNNAWGGYIVKDDAVYNTVDWNTFTTSLQVGATYHISKRLGVNMEANGNFIVPYNLKTGDYLYLWSLPVTAGLRYTVF